MLKWIKTIQDRDPARPSIFEVLLAYPGFHAVSMHRISHFLWRLKLRALARFWSHLGRFLTGIEIHPGATIGKYLFIDHGMGVVIGETAIIGDHVTLYHGVTLGGKGKDDHTGKRHPTLEDYSMVGSGAQVLGNITVHEHAHVGANAVVTKDVPKGRTAVGNPACLVRSSDEERPGTAYGLPPDHEPDPVGETITALISTIEKNGISLDDLGEENPIVRWKRRAENAVQN